MDPARGFFTGCVDAPARSATTTHRKRANRDDMRHFTFPEGVFQWEVKPAKPVLASAGAQIARTEKRN